MSALYMSQFNSMPLSERDQDERQLTTLSLASDSSIIYPFVINNTGDQESNYGDPNSIHFIEQKEINEHMFLGGSNSANSENSSFPTNHGTIIANNSSDQQSSSDQYTIEEYVNNQGKWMSSKMRIMRKMMNSDRTVMKKPRRTYKQDQNQNNGSNNNNNNNNNPLNGIVRVCSACNTTKTPLWRSGPCGPKSLCNACGIRQRKARRAMALAAANGGLVPNDPQNYKVKKEKRSPEIDRTLPIKKRCKINATSTTTTTTTTNMTTKKKVSLDEMTISLRKNSSFHRVFPKDETDAAFLLMALSCGLVRS